MLLDSLFNTDSASRGKLNPLGRNVFCFQLFWMMQSGWEMIFKCFNFWLLWRNNSADPIQLLSFASLVLVCLCYHSAYAIIRIKDICDQNGKLAEQVMWYCRALEVQDPFARGGLLELLSKVSLSRWKRLTKLYSCRVVLKIDKFRSFLTVLVVHASPTSLQLRKTFQRVTLLKMGSACIDLPPCCSVCL